MYGPLPAAAQWKASRTPANPSEEVLAVVEQHLVSQGGHSAASARKNVASKLEGRTLNLTAYRKKPPRKKTSSCQMLDPAVFAAPLKISRRSLKRKVAMAPPDLSLTATTSKQVALLTHEFDAHFHEMCSLAGCAQRPNNSACSDTKSRKSSTGGKGQSSSSNNSKSVVSPSASASGGRTKADMQAAVLARLPLFGARLTRLGKTQVLAIGKSGASAVAGPPGFAALVPCPTSVPSTAPAATSALALAAASADTPVTSPVLADSVPTGVNAVPASGATTPNQNSSALSGIVVGETRNAWTILSNDPERSDGTGTVHVVVKAGAKLALHIRESTFIIDGNAYVGRLSGQPLKQAEKRGETPKMTLDSSSKQQKTSTGNKKRPAIANTGTSLKSKSPKKGAVN